MTEEFQSGICGGTRWNPSISSSLSPCSQSGIVMVDHMGNFLWSSSDMGDMKTTTTTTKSCEESNNSISADSSMVFQSPQKPQQTDSDSGGSSGFLTDSSLQMMSFGPSSSTDWNQALLHGNERAENNYRSMIQEDLSSQMRKDWSPKSFTSAGDDSSINVFKSINQDFSLDQHQLKQVTSSGNCIVTCDGLSAGFPVNSASYGYSTALLQCYFEPDPQPQQSLYNNWSMNYVPAPNYGANSNELSTSWPKFSPFLKPSLPKQQLTALHFSNNTPFWNASASNSSGLSDISTGYFPSSQPQFLAPTLEEQINFSSHNKKSGNGEVRESASVGKKESSEPPFKRPRIETPSPLPTFKVRKEKLGDRITALQQLVSPFGKTDTASVLHEAIDYIKFLHDQVSVLTTSYMKQGTQIQQQQDQEGLKQGLKSRGLCLVPISSTFPVTNETTADFWTPTFGGTYR